MKKLQNNFTTPDQSKRLLELGVPVWTANIMFDKNRRKYELIETEDESWAETQRTLFYNGGAIPHWSVGRLIEIYLTCVLEYHPYDDFYTETPSLHLMAFDKDRLIEEIIEIMSEDEMDFSKLEE